VVDYPCAKFGDFGLSRFGFILRTDDRQQQERQNHRITDADDRYILTRLPSASVMMILTSVTEAVAGQRDEHDWPSPDSVRDQTYRVIGRFLRLYSGVGSLSD